MWDLIYTHRRRVLNMTADFFFSTPAIDHRNAENSIRIKNPIENSLSLPLDRECKNNELEQRPEGGTYVLFQSFLGKRLMIWSATAQSLNIYAKSAGRLVDHVDTEKMIKAKKKNNIIDSREGLLKQEGLIELERQCLITRKRCLQCAICHHGY